MITDNTSAKYDFKPYVSKLHHAARIYADKFGLAVFPVVPRGKKPLTQNGVKNATTVPEHIDRMWAEWPNANIGIDCTGLVVVDFDEPGAEEALRAFETEFRSPITPMARTGKGGFHLYFRSSEPIKNSVRQFRNNVDIRSAGGYVVAPPSVHENGNRYEWSEGRKLGKIQIALLPEDIAVSVKSTTSSDATMPKHPEYWQKIASEGAGKGQRNSTLAEFCGHLYRKNVDAIMVRELIHCWNQCKCNPPMNHHEVDAVLESIARSEIRRRSGGSANGRY
jgi:hypothetical protein